MTQYERTEEYEAPALQWLFREVVRLDDCLKQVGRTDEDHRRRVLEEFFFGAMASADPCEAGAKTYWVVVGLQDGDRLLLPHRAVRLHEYALCLVAEAVG